jgi:hypothetical protein
LLVPPTLVDRFADLLERTGMRGKCSIIPYPFGLGRVDRAVQGVSQDDLAHFLEAMRTRVAPWLDLTPEALTHWNALDLRTGQLLPLWEHLWSREQDRHSLTPYLALGLEILKNCGMDCTGVTSPWDFGAGVEEEYAEAILAAQRSVNGTTFSWYFLNMDTESTHVPPRLPVFRPEAGEAVVSIVCCDGYDFGRGLWSGGKPEPDMLLSADGQRGRLAEVLGSGGPAAFHTHWQTFFGQGSFAGLPALEEIANRIQEHFGDRIAWTGCADLAAYAAASTAITVRRGDDDGVTRLETATPFPCRRFTISLSGLGEPQTVLLDGRPLARSARDLTEDSYRWQDGLLTLCWPLKGTQRIEVR